MLPARQLTSYYKRYVTESTLGHQKYFSHICDDLLKPQCWYNFTNDDGWRLTFTAIHTSCIEGPVFVKLLFEGETLLYSEITRARDLGALKSWKIYDPRIVEYLGPKLWN